MSSGPFVISRSVGRKFIMGITGLFLVTFLITHLSGNFLLFKDDGGVAFNEYTRFMTTNPLIGVAEWILFAGFIAHIAYAVVLTIQNRKARPERYAFNKNEGSSSSWFSRNMGLSGTIVFAFLIIHLAMFWGRYQFGDETGTVTLSQSYHNAWKIKEDVTDQSGKVLVEKDSYVTADDLTILANQGMTEKEVKAISMINVVKASFKDPLVVGFYVLAMILLAFHLQHGFQSGFRSLGLIHKKYTPTIITLGKAFSVVVPLAFAAMPVYYFFFQ
ncbi:MAG: succinate dehydrogenase cytochrome b subunit [Bacteroidota bacterium]